MAPKFSLPLIAIEGILTLIVIIPLLAVFLNSYFKSCSTVTVNEQYSYKYLQNGDACYCKTWLSDAGLVNRFAVYGWEFTAIPPSTTLLPLPNFASHLVTNPNPDQYINFTSTGSSNIYVNINYDYFQNQTSGLQILDINFNDNRSRTISYLTFYQMNYYPSSVFSLEIDKGECSQPLSSSSGAARCGDTFDPANNSAPCFQHKGWCLYFGLSGYAADYCWQASAGQNYNMAQCNTMMDFVVKGIEDDLAYFSGTVFSNDPEPNYCQADYCVVNDCYGHGLFSEGLVCLSTISSVFTAIKTAMPILLKKKYAKEMIENTKEMEEIAGDKV